ncbi:hypothetical protein MKW94_013392 [Papaver nudicaule]|uniref:BHLH domain-containing protein n=1 Tax=Papaver nudicaule TaxID=74823 RepID=A0AA42AXK1_PAPNU|nr:hypothetical protein [Papaver nudicaule]
MDPQVQANAPVSFHPCPCPARPLTTAEYASTSSFFNSEVPPPGLSTNSSSSTSHSLAEKRRRQRINTHLSTLKRLIPLSDQKMDKGSLLGCVVDHLKELKRTNILDEIFQQESTIPNESDEVIVDHVIASATTNNNNNNGIGNSNSSNQGKHNGIYLKATVSCEDRPDIFMDLIEALKGLKMLRTVRTDIVTLGGRITLNIVLTSVENQEGGSNIIGLNSLKHLLKAALGRIVTSSSSSNWTTMSGFSSKRQRLLFLPHYSHLPSFRIDFM